MEIKLNGIQAVIAVLGSILLPIIFFYMNKLDRKEVEIRALQAEKQKELCERVERLEQAVYGINGNTN